MASMSSTSHHIVPHLCSVVCRSCMNRSLKLNKYNTKHMSRRIAVLAITVSTSLAKEAVLNEPNSALCFDFRMTAPDQTVEEAESTIRDHARALLGIKTLIESEDWREMQQELRKNSSLLKQDIYTLLQNKPGTMRPLLRKLYFNLFNNATKLDYAARDKDVGSVEELYKNMSSALADILSLILE